MATMPNPATTTRAKIAGAMLAPHRSSSRTKSPSKRATSATNRPAKTWVALVDDCMGEVGWREQRINNGTVHFTEKRCNGQPQRELPPESGQAREPRHEEGKVKHTATKDVNPANRAAESRDRSHAKNNLYTNVKHMCRSLAKNDRAWPQQQATAHDSIAFSMHKAAATTASASNNNAGGKHEADRALRNLVDHAKIPAVHLATHRLDVAAEEPHHGAQHNGNREGHADGLVEACAPRAHQHESELLLTQDLHQCHMRRNGERGMHVADHDDQKLFLLAVGLRLELRRTARAGCLRWLSRASAAPADLAVGLVGLGRASSPRASRLGAQLLQLEPLPLMSVPCVGMAVQPRAAFVPWAPVGAGYIADIMRGTVGRGDSDLFDGAPQLFEVRAQDGELLMQAVATATRVGGLMSALMTSGLCLPQPLAQYVQLHPSRVSFFNLQKSSSNRSRSLTNASTTSTLGPGFS
eukprot:CAMPEP_0170209634 /NCGR_PEP_ID=MMETSP0116_2-20130129/4407_1 /TAXON_ID=400756 /ORGANISM="Durinskia baltica, Strain CSIRO CS-38" /LENGTH=466 /DNA_ID=CAMNT_0010460117 /DNA_START=384 /DNA_END=1783 /DNA_ORIENTATION=-